MLIGLLFIGSLLVTFSPADSLSCIPCSWVRCTAPVNCKGGLVKSICGCCSICAKVEGERCGGQWQTLGRCDSGLKCVVRDGRLKAGAGTCEPGNFLVFPYKFLLIVIAIATICMNKDGPIPNVLFQKIPITLPWKVFFSMKPPLPLPSRNSSLSAIFLYPHSHPL